MMRRSITKAVRRRQTSRQWVVSLKVQAVEREWAMAASADQHAVGGLKVSGGDTSVPPC
jgi:hypothetical protein